MPECIFCKIVSGQIPSAKVYEDRNVLAFVDIGPIANGHTLVIPKEHFETVDQCPPQIVTDIWSVMPKITGAVKTAMQVPGYNILCNNGRVAGQVVEHVHFHVIPRQEGDKLFGNWPAFEYPKGKLQEIAAKISAKIAGF